MSDPRPSIIKPSGLPEEPGSQGGELAAQVAEDGWQQRDSAASHRRSPWSQQWPMSLLWCRGGGGNHLKRALENRVEKRVEEGKERWRQTDNLAGASGRLFNALINPLLKAIHRVSGFVLQPHEYPDINKGWARSRPDPISPTWRPVCLAMRDETDMCAFACLRAFSAPVS